MLIEASGSLGGMATIGLVPAWCPFSDKEKIIYKSIAEEIFNLAKEGVPFVDPKRLDWVPINKEQFKLVCDKLVMNSNVDVLFNTFVTGVDLTDERNIDCLYTASKKGLEAYKAKVYVDASADADLVYFAGGSFLKNEGNQSATHCFILSNIDIEAYKAYGIMHNDNKNCFIHDIVKDPKYPNIDSSHFCNNIIGPGTLGFNAGHILEVNPLDPKSISKALMEGRIKAHEYSMALKEYYPQAFKDNYLVETAPALGIRDSRRIEGDYVLTVEDYEARRTFEDEIGRNSYYIDIHRTVKEMELEKEGLIPKPYEEVHRYGKGESHGIPYRSLVPKSLDNVVVCGRSISTDRAVQGSVRVMPTCFVTGEAAGLAAAVALENESINMHKIDVEKLRKILIERGAYIK